MKREVYEVSINGFVKIRKHSWNAAKRSINGLIRKEIEQDGNATKAERHYFAYEKDSEGLNHVHGVETWVSDNNKTYNVTIVKIERVKS